MAATIKPGVYTTVHLTKLFCRFITKHQGTIMAVWTPIFTPGELAIVNAMFEAIVAACALLTTKYPNIPA